MTEEEDLELTEPSVALNLPDRPRRVLVGQDVVERVFTNSVNDYITVLGIARRARQILDDYPQYEEQLEVETATTLALEEFLEHRFKIGPAQRKADSPK